MSYGLSRRRNVVKPSKMHGTLCPCGKETKEVWQKLGPHCYHQSLKPDYLKKVNTPGGGNQP